MSCHRAQLCFTFAQSSLMTCHWYIPRGIQSQGHASSVPEDEPSGHLFRRQKEFNESSGSNCRGSAQTSGKGGEGGMTGREAAKGPGRRSSNRTGQGTGQAAKQEVEVPLPNPAKHQTRELLARKKDRNLGHLSQGDSYLPFRWVYACLASRSFTYHRSRSQAYIHLGQDSSALGSSRPPQAFSLTNSPTQTLTWSPIEVLCRAEKSRCGLGDILRVLNR